MFCNVIVIQTKVIENKTARQFDKVVSNRPVTKVFIFGCYMCVYIDFVTVQRKPFGKYTSRNSLGLNDYRADKQQKYSETGFFLLLLFHRRTGNKIALLTHLHTLFLNFFQFFTIL